MKIRDFPSTLDFAIRNLNRENTNDTNSFEFNFNENMQKAINYIKKIVLEQYGTLKISETELNQLISKNYAKIIDESYQNTDIHSLTMKYIAAKYIDSHRNEIPQLFKEIEEKRLIYSPREIYTDDFHQNILLCLLSLKHDFTMYTENMAIPNRPILDEILNFVKQYGEELGFKKYCDRYANQKAYPPTLKRACISYAYYTIFKLEGIDETKLSSKSPILKYKKRYSIKEYTSKYLEILEKVFKEELISSILSMFTQLNNLGEIEPHINVHNQKMKKIALPGLQYFSDTVNDDQKYPRVEKLLTREELNHLDIDTLLRMNSFYNNRFAKVIDTYSKALFILANCPSTTTILDGQSISIDSFPKDILDTLLLKYETLILPIKTYYAETQMKINEIIINQTSDLAKINFNSLDNGKQQVVLDILDLTKPIKKIWKREFETYFNKKLPNTENDLANNISLVNTLYNPIFLSYQFKNNALKAEYAYMFYISEREKSKSLNYGVVLSNDLKGNTLLLASDGDLNLPNRLHINKRDFTEFILAYTKQPLVRIYEGFDDFFVGNTYISTQLLLPHARQHKKYLRDLRNGKLKDKNDNISKITDSNQNLVDHLEFCIDSSKFMKSHKVTVNSVDKKGNPIQVQKQPIRYIDLTTGIIYSLTEQGKLVSQNGIFFGESEGR